MTKGSHGRDIFKSNYRAGIRDKQKLALACCVSKSTISKYMAKERRGDPLATEFYKKRKTKFTREVRNSMKQRMCADPTPSSRQLAGQLVDRFGGSFSASGVRKVLQSIWCEQSPCADPSKQAAAT